MPSDIRTNQMTTPRTSHLSDPTNIRSVLSALTNSDKLKHWHRPPKDFGPDNPEFSEYNRNDLTDPGDLSMISFTDEYAFGESSSDEVDTGEEDKQESSCFLDDLPVNVVKSQTSERWIDPAEVMKDKDRLLSLRVAEKARHQNLLLMRMQQMKLDDECKKLSEHKTVIHYQKYMNTLKGIKEQHKSKLEQYCKEREADLVNEERELRRKEEEIRLTVQQKEEEYAQYAEQKSLELRKLVADVEKREAEQKDIIQGLINDLYTKRNSFLEKHEELKLLLGEVTADQALNVSVEAMRSEALKPVDGILESIGHEVVTKDELQEVKSHLEVNITYVEDVLKALYAKRERAQQEHELACQQAKKASYEESQAKLAAEREAQELAQHNQQFQNVSAPATEEHHQANIVNINSKRFEDLKKKMEPHINVQNAMNNDKKKEIGRIATIINQLDTTNHNVNREKLQKLLTFLDGRNVHHNNKTYCTNSDPVITAYAKFRLIKDMVKVALDTQAKDGGGIAAYSWLIVSLIGVYPDLWEIFLYHIYSTCPYLVPLLIYQKDGQSQEDFDKERGKRQKEQLDVYLSRMGNAALMFGLVLSKMCKKNGMPEEAPIVGWKLLAGILMLDPSPGVSAAILRHFLLGVGADLQQMYGKQFAKLMEYAMSSYMMRVEEVTDATEQGRSLRNQLQTLFAEYKQTHKLKPNEYIDKYY